MMTTVWRSIRDYWIAQRAESLAAFRILLGLTLLASLLTGYFRFLPMVCAEDTPLPVDFNDAVLKRQGRIHLLRGPDNIPLLGEWLPKDWAYHKDKNGEVDEKKPTRWSYWLENYVSPEDKLAWSEWGAKPSSHYLLATLYVLSLVGLTVGFRPRLMAFVAALLASTFYHRFWEMSNGGDNLFRNALYFLILAPSGLTWSVDRWLQTRSWSIDNRLRRLTGMPPLRPGEPVFVPWWWVPWVWLMQLQICIMYFFTGLYKHDSDYLTGEALYWVMNDLEVTRWSYEQMPVPLFVCKLLTWTTLLFESSFIFLVWIGARPRWLLVTGFALHSIVFLWLKSAYGVPFAVADFALVWVGGAMVGVLIWLRLIGGRWSGVMAPDATAESGRAVLLATVILHEALLLALSVKAMGAKALLGWAMMTAPLADLLFVAAVGCFIGAMLSPRLRWLLVFGYAGHAGSYFLTRTMLGQEITFWEVYVVAAGIGLVGMLLWLGVQEGRWWGPATVRSLAETGRWVLIVLVVIHVGGLLYRAASTMLVPVPYLATGFMISLLLWSGPSWRWVLLLGVGLHLGILLTMEIGWFSQVTLCFYVLFVPGEKISEVVRVAFAWLRGEQKAVALPAVAANGS